MCKLTIKNSFLRESNIKYKYKEFNQKILTFADIKFEYQPFGFRSNEKCVFLQLIIRIQVVPVYSLSSSKSTSLIETMLSYLNPFENVRHISESLSINLMLHIVNKISRSNCQHRSFSEYGLQMVCLEKR